MKLTIKNPLMKLSAIVSTYFVSSSAFAQSDSFIGVSQTASSNIYAATNVISTASYVCGAAFATGGLLSFKKHAENPAQEPINKGIGRVAVGAGLCALPFVINTAFNSMGVDENASVGITNASGPRL
jgi:hypothetical protein